MLALLYYSSRLNGLFAGPGAPNMPFSRQDTEQRQSAVVGAILLAATISVSAGGLMVFYHLPPQKGEVGVVFPPWTDQASAIAQIVAAGGLIVNSGRFPNVLIAYAHDGDFARRVMARGAWFVGAARGLCGPVNEVTP